MMRNLGIGCLGLIILAGAGVTLANLGKNNTSIANNSQASPSSQSTAATPTGAHTTPSATHSVPSSVPSKAAATPAAIPSIDLSGSGQQATQAFTVTSGLAIITAQCSCSANFIVELLDSSGQSVDIPINVIGAYSGSVSEGLQAGSYILKVDADAAWSISVTQPRNVKGASLTQTYSSSGQKVVGPFAAGGAIRIQAQNSGSANFIVEVVDRDGNLQDIPINEIGAYNGSTLSNNLSNGPFYLKVDSDGNWSIVVSNP